MKNINEKDRAKWAEKYTHTIDFTVDDKMMVLRPPNMMDLKRAFTVLSDEGEIEFAEDLLNNLYIGGDREIINNDDYFFPAKKQMKKLLDFEEYKILKKEDGTIQITIQGHVCVVNKPTRNDLKVAERKNRNNKPFVTQEQLFLLVVVEKEKAFDDVNTAEIRFPLYKALEEIQNEKIAALKKH